MTAIEEFRIRNLRGAVCEYLDENLTDEFLKDLRQILDEEEQYFSEKASSYIGLRKKLFSGHE